MLRAKINGRPYDKAAFEARAKSAVAEIVKQQADAGVDIPSDGELSKPMFADYIADRLSGFEGENTGPPFVNFTQRPEPFPAFAVVAPSEGWLDLEGEAASERSPARLEGPRLRGRHRQHEGSARRH